MRDPQVSESAWRESLGYVALRWKAVFLPAVVDLPWKPAEPFALAVSGFAPEEALASFSRRAWSFCSFGLRPVLRVGRGFDGASVMKEFYTDGASEGVGA